MKLAKYTLFSLLSLLLCFQASAQPDTRRMNISIGIFTPSATSYDYEGAIGVIGSTGYTVDDIEPGDMFWDDASRYRVDSIEIIVAGSSAMVWITDIYGAGAPMSGRGTLGQPTPNMGLQPMTENGSNFITEAQEAKILTDNMQRLDSLAGDGNGIISALPTNPVTIDANNNALIIDSTSTTRIGAIGTAKGDLVVSGNTSLPSSLSHIAGADTSQVNIRAATGITLFSDKALNVDLSEIIFNRVGTEARIPANGSFVFHEGEEFGIDFDANAHKIRIGDYAYNWSGGPLIEIDRNEGKVTIGDDVGNNYGALIEVDGDGIIKIGDPYGSTTGSYINFDVPGEQLTITAESMIISGGAYEYYLPTTADPNENDIMYWPSPDAPAFVDVNTLVNTLFSSNGTVPDGRTIDVESGGTFNIKSDDGIIIIGDVNEVGSGSKVTIDNDGEEIIFNAYVTEFHGPGGLHTNFRAYADDVELGDKDGTGNGTLIDLADASEQIVLRADNGISHTGTSYSYKFPTVNPTATTDSLDRAITWRRTVGGWTEAFKVVNDSDFRTASVSGNIYRYDDIIECVPDITVHLPAPAAALVGKIYHIYVGGAGAGSGVTIDVVDGSSTIQLGAGLTMTSTWETYTLMCNGSQWVVLNHKP